MLEEKYYSRILESDPYLRALVDFLQAGGVPPADLDDEGD
jgi:hypothetical protein